MAGKKEKKEQLKPKKEEITTETKPKRVCKPRKKPVEEPETQKTTSKLKVDNGSKVVEVGKDKSKKDQKEKKSTKTKVNKIEGKKEKVVAKEAVNKQEVKTNKEKKTNKNKKATEETKNKKSKTKELALTKEIESKPKAKREEKEAKTKVKSKTETKEEEKSEKYKIELEEEKIVAKETKPPVKPQVRYSDEDLEIFRKRILEVKKEALEELEMLKERLEDLNAYDLAEEGSIYSMHMAEQGSEIFEKEKVYAQIQRINEYIKKLDDALKRIDDKTYGICRVCGILIAKERLLAVPITTLSASYKIHKKCPKDGIDRIEPLVK